ncbi:MAG: type I phosphomannose isomerase catalytic subunit [Planctomycetaceae bacterium]
MSSQTLYPFRFTPILKRYIWGGRKLQTVLGKPADNHPDTAESWEIVEHPSGTSTLENGPLAGKSLTELLQQFGPEVYGQHFPQPRFPLLFKLLDCNRHLSVQVHPTDAEASKLTPPDLGKTEAWIILAAEPGALLYAGLKRGFDRSALEREVSRGTTELCLHKIEPKVGDCFFIPAGVVHALGAGLLVAEIQQSSDTTYRLFDWNRVGTDGKPRALHIRESLDATNYGFGPISAQIPKPTDKPHVQQLVHCDKFVLDRWTSFNEATLGGDNRFHIVSVLHGSVQLAGDPSGTPLTMGQSALLPASLGPTSIKANTSDTILLDMYLP